MYDRKCHILWKLLFVKKLFFLRFVTNLRSDLFRKNPTVMLAILSHSSYQILSPVY